MTQQKLRSKPRLRPTYGASIHQGVAGKNQEDSYTFGPDSQDAEVQPWSFIAVADGVTSTTGGGKASEIAVEVVREVLSERGSVTSGQILEAVFHRANQAILNAVNGSADNNSMKTTLVVALVQGGMLSVAHMGDSRAYLLRSGRLHQLTIDHTRVQEAYDRGAMDRQAMREHPNRHVITRFLGERGRVDTDIQMVEPETDLWDLQSRRMTSSLAVQPEDVVLVCSDGVTEQIDQETLQQLLHQYRKQPQRAADALVKLAVERQETDNITAVVMRLSTRSFLAPLIDVLPQSQRLLTGFLLVLLLLAIGLSARYFLRQLAGSADVSSATPATAQPEQPPTSTSQPMALANATKDAATPMATAEQVAQVNSAVGDGSATPPSLEESREITSEQILALATEAPTVTDTPSPMPTETSTSTATQTPTPSETPTALSTASATRIVPSTGTFTPTSSPTAISSPTRRPTTVPLGLPTPTPTPTILPTAAPAQAATRSPTPQPTQSSTQDIQATLREPGVGFTFAGEATFEWTFSSGSLGSGQKVELAFWRSDDSWQNAKSPKSAMTNTSVVVKSEDLIALSLSGDLKWGLILWENDVRMGMISPDRTISVPGVPNPTPTPR